MDKYIDNMPWAGIWPWSKQCKARKAPELGVKDDFHGRCELAPHDSDIDHALERGMIWVRWQDGEVMFTTPDYSVVHDDELRE